ncbi:MAG: VIT1/CCC1 transporter family protein [bacterium]
MNDANTRKMLTQWREERNAGWLYERLAQAEKLPELAEVYRRLAATELRHAGVWAERLRSLGSAVPVFRPAPRTIILGWLAGWLSPAAVVPGLAAMENSASNTYIAQIDDADGVSMAADERGHARLLNVMAGASGGMDGSTVARLEGRHRSGGGNALRAGVLGANDGLVSVFSLVMGVAGAQAESKTVLLTGFAGLLAGSISMALGEWLSVQSSRELVSRQIEIEKQELEDSPEEEIAELALIYQAKGIDQEQAQRLARQLLSDPKHGLDTLVREELGADPGELGGSAWVAAGTSFALFAVGGIVPVVPFIFTSGLTATLWSATLSAVALFIIGAGITLVTGCAIWWSGLRMVIFGLAAAAITYGVGRMIGVSLQ